VAGGGLWVAWPCGLLRAALANSPACGALVMGGFAAVTAAGLLLGFGVWAWFGGAALAQRSITWAIRGSGGMLAAASGWALTHGLWARFAAWCLS
jgi:hypothetical protein